MAIALIRTLILYLFIMAGIRLMGKRQVGELEPSELVLAMLMSDLAAVPMQDFSTPLLAGLIPMATLLCMTMILSILTMKSIRFRALLCGTPTIVMEKGELLPEAMRKVRMSVDELTEELRLQGVTDLTQVHYAILETSGQVSVLLYQSNQPPSASDLRVPVEEPGLPVTLISDGHIMTSNLSYINRDSQWLMASLQKLGYQTPEDLLLLTVDETGKFYHAAKEAMRP